jgi:RNA polymerase sigma-70 factor (ECF subfamily)
MKESDAIRRLKNGDISGLDDLVSLYYVRAVRSAYLVLQDRTQAEDVVQSAFIHAYEHIDQFDATRAFEPWFLRSVVNRARMLGRRQASTVPLMDGAEYDENSLPDQEPSPEELLIAAETTEAIWEVLDKLSLDQRAVIVRRYYLGQSEVEIASELDCPPGTVKSRLFTARHRLRELIPSWLKPISRSDQ